jgi:hypothetical protein
VEKKEVDELFDSICRDPRHTDIKVVFESDSPFRSMPAWVMGLSTGDNLAGTIGAMDYYISQEVTKQICESMEGEVGRLFLQFIGAQPIS